MGFHVEMKRHRSEITSCVTNYIRSCGWYTDNPHSSSFLTSPTIIIIMIIMIVMLASAVASLFAQVYENGWPSAPKENLLRSEKVRTLDKIPN